MVLLGSGLLAGMFAISYLGEDGTHAWSMTFGWSVVVAIVAMWAFLRHIRRSSHPFIAPRLIHGPGLGAINLLNGLFGGIPSGVVALIPLYATNRYGIDALRSGTLLVAQGAATTLLSVAAALRSMSLSVGSITTIAIATAIIASSPDHGSAQAWVYVAAAVSLVVALPLTGRVQEHRGSW